jgi:leucyl-tRNA synthetase
VINPDEIVGKFGADTLRMYEMFIGPFDQMVVWSEESLEGVHRFIKRVWKLVISCELSVVSSAEAKFKMAQLIKTVDEDLEATKFNTAVASMMEFLNWWQDNQTAMGNDLVEAYVKLMAPMAPFVAEELWQRLQQRSDNLRPAGVKTAFNSVHKQSWPVVDGGDESSEKVTVVVQVNGKVREKLEVSKAQANDEKVICKLALASDKVKNYVNGPKYRQIFVPGKLVNFVV